MLQLQDIKVHDAEATLFAASIRLLGEVGLRDISFDIGGKKSRRKYITATRASGEVQKIWIKPAWTWRGLADAVLFPWKKYQDAHSGYHSVLFSCESAKTRGVTHLLAVAGDETTGLISFAHLYTIEEVAELVHQQSQIIENRYYSAHSSSLVVLSYAADFDEAALIAGNAGEDMFLLAESGRNAQEHSTEELRVIRRTGRAYKRDRKIREAVLAYAKGTCECCGELGFELEDGSRYLETHHIIEVSARGPDSVDNVVAICANCHRKAHYAKDRLAFERVMISALRKRGRNSA